MCPTCLEDKLQCLRVMFVISHVHSNHIVVLRLTSTLLIKYAYKESHAGK